jgi:hypothetical protein
VPRSPPRSNLHLRGGHLDQQVAILAQEQCSPQCLQLGNAPAQNRPGRKDANTDPTPASATGTWLARCCATAGESREVRAHE